MTPNPGNKRFLTIIFFVILTSVCLLAVEVLLRAFSPFHFCDNSSMYRYDAELQIVPKKNLNIVRSKDYLEEYFTNAYSTTNFSDSFAPYKFKIFAVGDSYTQGIGLPLDASYPAQLDLILNLEDRGYRNDYAVINLGMASYGGEQYLLTIKKYLKLLGKPDYILLLGCWNDPADDLRFQAFQRGESMNLVTGHPRFNWLVKPVSWLVYDTELGKRLYWLGKSVGKPSPSPSASAPQPPSAPSAARQVHIYRQIHELAKEQQIRLILSWANMDESYPWLKQWAAEQQIPFADWLPAFHSVREHLPALPFANPHSGGHHRGWVNYLIAQSFARLVTTPTSPSAAASHPR